MSNSVVKVTNSTLNDSLLLLVGEDGTVTPSKEIVEAYLNAKPGAMNLQVMHINKSDNQSIEVAVDNMLYLPDAENNEEIDFDKVAYNLYNIKLDHDYTSFCTPDEVDDLAKTLSILDGDEVSEFSNVTNSLEVKSIDKSNITEANVLSKEKSPNMAVKPSSKNYKKKTKTKLKNITDKEDDCNDLEYECEDHKEKIKRIGKQEFKHKENLVKSPKTDKPIEETELSKLDKSQSSSIEAKAGDKKLLKKDRRSIKSTVPDDFALFSTPDIIRRVGGKESASVNYLHTSTLTDLCSPDTKPVKIETRSKSVSESPQVLKQNRLSLDGKVLDKQFAKIECKRDKSASIDFKSHRTMPEYVPKKGVEYTAKSDVENSAYQEHILDSNVGHVIMNENKPFPSNLSELEPHDLGSTEQNMTLDGNGLDLDPTLLDNINTDLISEDILYQVAQSLVSNTELQNAIDKSLNDENLVLETVQDVLNEKQNNVHSDKGIQVMSGMSQKGTQIVRPDGRIVVIPPIERPTTRSRNKRKEVEKSFSKISRKPLDEEHVSGNELDSSGEDEEESEDDPNKLWCICNQPHNNRFMICCDTCEEWYHGKCVNITKAMGQQMESEGREWICLFCKDPLLKRPQAAARRIRKASRNSRQSSDSAGSTKVVEPKSASVPCVVCQKPSRTSSIFCSEACILAHAQGVERVVVFERSTGNMLTGNKAPSAANLEQWLKDHPGYEVVRSAGKIVTTKHTHNVGPSKLKLLNSSDIDTASPHVQNKGMSEGVTRNFTRNQHQSGKSALKPTMSGLKIVTKQVTTLSPQKEKPNILSPSKESSVSSSKIKVLQTSLKSSPSPGSNKDKVASTKTPKVRHLEQASSTIPQAKQENIRENVQKTVFEQLTNRLKMVGDLKLSEEELKNISNEIESQLYKCFGDTGQKYRNKYRSLIFNIKDIKNQTLWRRICEKTINPYQLVRLSPDDLASQELALWREREAKHQLDMIKKSELELLKCNRQYVLKTHKGEQILEDKRPKDHIDNTEVITSLTDGSNGEKSERKRDTSRDKSSKHGHKERDKKLNKEKLEGKSHHGHKSSSRDRDRSRKRSRSRDKNSKHIDKRKSRSQGRDRHRRSSHKSSRHKKDTYRGSSTDKLDKKSKEILEQLVDNKIVPPLEDRLWKHVSQEDILPTPVVESDSDHEPTSTVTIPTPPRNNDSDEYFPSHVLAENENDKPTGQEYAEEGNSPVLTPSSRTSSEEIWRGTVNMVDVAQISITAHEVSGDCNGLGSELPPNLDIVGRISPDTVWDYIGKMKCSNSKVISIVRLNAINVEEKMPYLALYSYLSSRNRLGVVKSTSKAVKDFYVLPLAAQKPIPQALLPLNGPGFEEARPALLLGILVRDKRKRPFLDSISPVITSVKKTKTEPLVQVTPPARSYTPPPVKESRHKLPLPPPVVDQDWDEPYSPEDSDPDSIAPSTSGDVPSISTNFLKPDVGSSQAFQPFVNKFDDIPGLDNPTLPSSTQEIERQMEKLNKEIEMQKSEINSISQNIATASTEIGTSALASIALPSNLQQILDSIKTIGSTSTETVETKSQGITQESADLTIPLILPTTFSRHSVSSTTGSLSENTIPLNLPSKKKISIETDKSGSVLSSLSEEDLIRKAEEMLEDSKNSSKGETIAITKTEQDELKPTSDSWI